MTDLLTQYLDHSLTAYHAHDNAVSYLAKEGYTELKENEEWKIERNKGYYVSRDGSALIAFNVGKELSFNIVASHADSPCFKIKANPELKVDGYFKFNVERYGGGIFYSWFDRPLTVAGRVILKDGAKLEAKTFTSEKTFVIPSVAIHFNRSVNDGVKLNPQVDMCPLIGTEIEKGLEIELEKFANGKEICDFDLYVVCSQKPFSAGFADEFICSPRIDNLTSAFSSVEAIASAKPKAINVAYIADNEEVGSATKQGAGSKFLFDTLRRISASLGYGEEEFERSLASSFMVSDDNAHAVHPNHPELSDPTNRVKLGGGVVIKHHANQNYTSDAFSSSIIKTVFDKAGAAYQDFYMRSDLPCGGTLGAISSKNLSIRSVDIGLAQLAMHSAVETFAAKDYEQAVKGLTAFYSCALKADGSKTEEIIF